MSAAEVVDTSAFASIYPFAPHHLDVKGGRLHYVDEGPRDAPAMLMLHGNPTWSFFYRELISAFSATHRVVAPDHIGCGLSDKPQDFSYRLVDHIENVGRLVRALELEDITLVVHDWGGAIGMGLAVERPELVERFVVFNTAAFPAARMPPVLALCRAPALGALMIRGLNAFARGALLTCVKKRERLSPAIRAGYLAPYDSWERRVAHLRFVQDIPMRPSHSGYALLQRIGEGLERFRDHPMLIVWGAQDFVFDDHFLEEWQRRFPGARTEYVEDAGHYVIEDAHERIVPWIREFVGVGASGARSERHAASGARSERNASGGR